MSRTTNEFGQDMELIREICKPIWQRNCKELSLNVEDKKRLKNSDWVELGVFCEEVALALRIADAKN